MVGGVWVVAELHQVAAHAHDGAQAAGFGAAGLAPDEVEGGGGGVRVVFDGADFARGAADLERETRADDLQATVSTGQGFPCVVDRQNAPFTFDHAVTDARSGATGRASSRSTAEDLMGERGIVSCRGTSAARGAEERANALPWRESWFRCSTMKKLLKALVALFLLGVIAVVAIGFFFLGPIVTKTVNTVGPKITGTRVELDAAKVSPLTGGATLAGLFVGNPEGWTGDKAFYLGELRASVQPTSLLGDHIVVNEVYIDGPEFVYEKRLRGGSNIDALLKQIEENTGGGKTPSATEPGSESKKPMKFAVKSFVLKNAKASVIVGGRTVTVPLPPITITDLGVEEGGITADQIATKVLQRVLAQIGTAAAGVLTDVGGAVIEGGKDGAKAAGEAAKGALNKLLGK